jgi:hypothetical protein
MRSRKSGNVTLIGRAKKLSLPGTGESHSLEKRNKQMGIRDTFNSSVASNHASAEVGGITFGTGATVRNQTTWSRASAKAALANADITQSQFISLMQAISSWEEAQNGNAKATLRNGGDSFPV